MCDALEPAAEPTGQLVARLHQVVPDLYRQMSQLLGTPETHVMAAILRGGKWVWVGSGFVAPHEVCFDAPAHFPPYLFTVPSVRPIGPTRQAGPARSGA